MTRDPDFQVARDTLLALQRNLESVIHGQPAAVRLLVTAFAAGGHALLEDVPGTGKTTLAKALAASCRAEFQRVQFTPDLLPTDVTGVTVYEPLTQQFRFEPGPVFCNILLADEINRASPRTQSALLEAMAEAQVTVERERHRLDPPFFVIATQNPIELHGTYPLPEAQLDRFAMRFRLGYVAPEVEVAILRSHSAGDPLADLRPCADLDQVRRMQAAARAVRVSETVQRYIVALTGATRAAPGVLLGASPRASLTLMQCAKAWALLAGDEFVTPEAVRAVAAPVIAHRLVLDAQARYGGAQAEFIVGELLRSVPVPV